MTDIQRMQFHHGQFLVEEDFNDEQAYHRQMRWRHNRSLHTPGVVEGLEVTRTADKQITVSPGMAIDSHGHEIVILPSSTLRQPISLEGVGTDRTIQLTIRYREVGDKRTQIDNEDRFTRTNERPKFIIYGGSSTQNPEEGDVEVKTENAPPSDSDDIPLSRITLDNSGNISNIDDTIRQSAGSRLRTPRQFVVDIVGDQEIIPLPEGTTTDDWEVFVSLRELLEVRRPNGGILSQFDLKVFAEPEEEGWRVTCRAEIKDEGSIIEGIANYLLLRK